jgi:hypothetical protein
MARQTNTRGRLPCNHQGPKWPSPGACTPSAGRHSLARWRFASHLS